VWAGQLEAAATQARDVARAAKEENGGDFPGAAEALLNVVAQIEPRMLASEEEAKAVALSFRQSFGPRMRGLENEFAKAQEQFENARSSVEQSVGVATQKLDEVHGEIDSVRGRVDELISDQDTKFTEAQERRAARFDEVVHKAEATLEESRSAFEERASEAREHISQLEADISQTAAALGGRAIAIDNSEESFDQTRKAFWWTVVTVVLLVAAAAIPLAIGIESAGQSVEAVAGKITVALVLAGIASYTAGVARHHRQRAATARRLAIELNAFGPFVAELPKPDRDDLRSTIIWRFFGPPEAVNQKMDGAPEPGPGILEALRMRRKKRVASPSEVDEGPVDS
jgi:uncharacterized membrane protein